MGNDFEQLNRKKIDQQEENANKKSKKEENKNNLSPELLPYRDEMQKWVENNMDDISTFLEYRNARFKLVYGNGFYHQPGTDIISLDVTHYKKYRDQGLSIEQSIFFPTFHEFAHLKTMMELDRAGKYNHLEQFNYEERKIIRSKEDPTKFVSLQPTYREFYNILEDAIVNYLVFNTRHFSAVSGERGKKARAEIVDLYTDKLFPLFKKTQPGKGEYAINNNPLNNKEEPIIYVGEGKGDLVIMRKEDYERGFDWNETVPALGRSSQFLTFFMKNQMIDLKESDIYDQENNPNGKHKLNEDVAIALTRPLSEAYKILLEKVVEKYQKDPNKFKRYSEFMTDVIKVRFYEEKDKKIVEGKSDLVENVVDPRSLLDDGIKIDINLAVLAYKQKLKQIGAEMGISNILSYKFLDLFNQFKTLKRSHQYSWTFPLKYNLAERSRIARKVLEPIFSLLCILDDSFDVKVIEEPPLGGDGGGESPSSPPPVKPEWKKGDKVINIKEGSPNKGKKGIISNVVYDSDGKILSVEVEYYEEK